MNGTAVRRLGGWPRTGRPAWRGAHSRDKCFWASTRWGCSRTGPVLPPGGCRADAAAAVKMRGAEAQAAARCPGGDAMRPARCSPRRQFGESRKPVRRRSRRRRHRCVPGVWSTSLSKRSSQGARMTRAVAATVRQSPEDRFSARQAEAAPAGCRADAAGAATGERGRGSPEGLRYGAALQGSATGLPGVGAISGAAHSMNAPPSGGSAGGRERGAPPGAEPTAVTSAVGRAPGGAVRGRVPSCRRPDDSPTQQAPRR